MPRPNQHRNFAMQPSNGVRIGNKEWINGELHYISDLAADKADEFSLAVADNIDWINGFMSGVVEQAYERPFSNVAELMQTPRRLKGRSHASPDKSRASPFKPLEQIQDSQIEGIDSSLKPPSLRFPDHSRIVPPSARNKDLDNIVNSTLNSPKTLPVSQTHEELPRKIEMNANEPSQVRSKDLETNEGQTGQGGGEMGTETADTSAPDSFEVRDRVLGSDPIPRRSSNTQGSPISKVESRRQTSDAGEATLDQAAHDTKSASYRSPHEYEEPLRPSSERVLQKPTDRASFAFASLPPREPLPKKSIGHRPSRRDTREEPVRRDINESYASAGRTSQNSESGAGISNTEEHATTESGPKDIRSRNGNPKEVTPDAAVPGEENGGINVPVIIDNSTKDRSLTEIGPVENPTVETESHMVIDDQRHEKSQSPERASSSIRASEAKAPADIGLSKAPHSLEEDSDDEWVPRMTFQAKSTQGHLGDFVEDTPNTTGFELPQHQIHHLSGQNQESESAYPSSRKDAPFDAAADSTTPKRSREPSARTPGPVTAAINAAKASAEAAVRMAQMAWFSPSRASAEETTRPRMDAEHPARHLSEDEDQDNRKQEQERDLVPHYIKPEGHLKSTDASQFDSLNSRPEGTPLLKEDDKSARPTKSSEMTADDNENSSRRQSKDELALRPASSRVLKPMSQRVTVSAPKDASKTSNNQEQKRDGLDVAQKGERKHITGGSPSKVVQKTSENRTFNRPVQKKMVPTRPIKALTAASIARKKENGQKDRMPLAGNGLGNKRSEIKKPDDGSPPVGDTNSSEHTSWQMKNRPPKVGAPNHATKPEVHLQETNDLPQRRVMLESQKFGPNKKTLVRVPSKQTLSNREVADDSNHGLQNNKPKQPPNLKTFKRPLENELRSAAQASNSVNESEAKRRKTGEEPTRSSTASTQKSGLGLQPIQKSKPTNAGATNSNHSQGLPSVEIVKYTSEQIKFADNTSQQAQLSGPTVDNLPEIDSEYSDEDDSDDESKALSKKKSMPAWADSPELKQLLRRQQKTNPDEIFGPMIPLQMEEVFRGRERAIARFRPRSSSANWMGNDKLTEQEIDSYAKTMGYR